MGPLVTAAARDRVKRLVDSGVEQGAELAVDGRNFTMQGYENGFFVGGCLFDRVTSDMDIYKEEIFGPVLSEVRTKDYNEALELPMKNYYGIGTAIFTRDGDTARDFCDRTHIGLLGMNVTHPVTLPYYTFVGRKASRFDAQNTPVPHS